MSRTTGHNAKRSERNQRVESESGLMVAGEGGSGTATASVFVLRPAISQILLNYFAIEDDTHCGMLSKSLQSYIDNPYSWLIWSDGENLKAECETLIRKRLKAWRTSMPRMIRIKPKYLKNRMRRPLWEGKEITNCLMSLGAPEILPALAVTEIR